MAAMRLWPRDPAISAPPAPNPQVSYRANQVKVSLPGRVLVADLLTLDDELLAYIMLEHLRGVVSCKECRLWLTAERDGKGIAYRMRLQPPSNVLAAMPFIYGLQFQGLAHDVSYRWVSMRETAEYSDQTEIFDRAYHLPAYRRVDHLPRSEVIAYIRRFIRFKAATDRRVRLGLSPLPRPPDRKEAVRLAEDIVAVTEFYALPLAFFLGIGAMENNYMHVQGDLENTIWKKRVEKGDVVLKRGRRGFLVRNESSGIWQITRETLRHAHRLYLKDKRDYSTLPPHLRPPQEFDVDNVPPDVLTTYAALFLRELFDRFDGDVALAVGAYNGGPGNPNPRYEAGVRAAAEHARNIMERAAVLKGIPAVPLRSLPHR
jgi:hypothetical protein